MKFTVTACLLAGLTLSACSSQPQVRVNPPPQLISRPAPPPAAARPCRTCGHVEKIDVITSTAVPTERAVLGGVVGGVLTKPAGPAGAKPGPGTRSYRLTIRLDGGRQLLVTQKVISPNLRIGSRVRVEGTRVMLLR